MAECYLGDVWLVIGGTLGDTTAVGFATSSLNLNGWTAKGMASHGPECSFGTAGEKVVSLTIGGPSPFPQMVTSNYKRVFTVGGAFSDCGIVSFTFAFSTTAADFHGSPGAECTACAN